VLCEQWLDLGREEPKRFKAKGEHRFLGVMKVTSSNWVIDKGWKVSIIFVTGHVTGNKAKLFTPERMVV
jgi:hypothetical protein